MEIYRLRRWLRSQHLTQAQLAAQLKYHYGYVRRVVSGHEPITAEFRWRFGQCYGFNLAVELLGQDGCGANGASANSHGERERM